MITIKKIHYSSPGLTDIIGLGKFLDIVFKCVKYYFPNKNDKLQTELLTQDILYKKIENLEKMGYSKKEIKKLIRIKNLSIINLEYLIQEKKVREIKLIEEIKNK